MPRATPTRLGPPVSLPERELAWDQLLAEADRAGAPPARLAWGMAAVCDLLIADLDRSRLLEDDEVESIVSDLRRWCRGDAGSDELSVRLAAWEPVTGPRKFGLHALLAVRNIVGWCLDFADESRDQLYGRSWSFGDAMADAVGALVMNDEGYGEARAMVRAAFERDLAEEAPPLRASNPAAGSMGRDRLRPSELELVEAMSLAGAAAGRRDNPGRARKDGVARRVEPALPPPPSIGAMKVSRAADGFEVMAYFRDEYSNTRQAGYLIARALPAPLAGCEGNFEALALRLRLPRMGYMRVTSAYLDEDWRRRRLGLSLYATALREAALNYGAALAPDECGPGGSTSPMARDVWNSSSLRALAEVEGEVFYWKGTGP